MGLIMHLNMMEGIGKIFRVVQEISMAAVNHVLLNTFAARKNIYIAILLLKHSCNFTSSLNSSCIYISSSFYDIGRQMGPQFNQLRCYEQSNNFGKVT